LIRGIIEEERIRNELYKTKESKHFLQLFRERLGMSPSDYRAVAMKSKE
jgi:methylphosphotriester-DNA--protein-cysteine methyltransferase